jgi:uncharacterized protein (DUF2252 family)
MSSVSDRPGTDLSSSAASTRRTRRSEAGPSPLPPLSSHAAWDGGPSGRDPVAILTGQETTRVPELIAIRHERMSVSPFAFYRGSAAVMASDLANTPSTDLRVQLCGDAHLANFGGFQSPERDMVFDINDFDETLPGPFEWDVKRLAASIIVAGREQFKRKECRAAALAAARRYREALLKFSQLGELEVWYSRLDVSSGIQEWARLAGAKAVKTTQKNVAKARQKDSTRAYRQLVRELNGRIAFVSDAPLIVPLDELTSDQDQARDVRAFLDSVVRSYRATLNTDRARLIDRFELVDVARKVVGVGSVGTRCWIALFLGRYRSDPLVIQCKEAQASVLEPYAGRSRYVNSGQRIVEGQRFMQAASDILLGWTHVKRGLDGGERDFYMRQLWDGKLSAQVGAFTLQVFTAYGEMCAWTLARAHARSGNRVAIASYLGTSSAFEEALATFAEAYADQNERDFAAFKAATVSSGIGSAARDAPGATG